MLTFCSQVFPGISAIATFTLAGAAPPTNANIAAYGSLLQVGFAFALGIAFAIITCGPTSGGHFNPAVTLCLAYWQGFPWRKVPYYIFAQILGSFLAALLVMGKSNRQRPPRSNMLTTHRHVSSGDSCLRSWSSRIAFAHGLQWWSGQHLLLIPPCYSDKLGIPLHD